MTTCAKSLCVRQVTGYDMRGIIRPWGKALSMDPIDLQEDTKELEHLSTELEGLRYKNALSSRLPCC